MCWLWTPGGPWREADRGRHRRLGERAVGAGGDRRGGPHGGRTARVQLKADTGLGRGGCQPADWPALVAAARAAEAEGAVEVTGLWSHFACADEPGHPANAAQLAAFREAARRRRTRRSRPRGAAPRQLARDAHPARVALRPRTHRASPSTASRPSPEVGVAADLGLRPAMTLSAALALVKRVPAGHGVSYGHTYTHARARPPSRSSRSATRTAFRGTPPAPAPCWSPGKWRTVAGRVAMDQFVVDLGGDAASAGRRGGAVRPRRPGRADRGGLGAGGGHHLVRDRYPDQRPGIPDLYERTVEYGGLSDERRGGGGGAGGRRGQSGRGDQALPASVGRRERRQRRRGRLGGASAGGAARGWPERRWGWWRRASQSSGMTVNRAVRRKARLALDAAGPYGSLRGTAGTAYGAGRHRAVLRDRGGRRPAAAGRADCLARRPGFHGTAPAAAAAGDGVGGPDGRAGEHRRR